MTSHNAYPGAQAQTLEFPPDHVQFLENFNSALVNAHFAAGNDEAMFRQLVERQVYADTRHIQTPIADPTALVVAAESLGATRDQAQAMDLLDIVTRSTLLSSDDANLVRGYADNVWLSRNHGIDETAIADRMRASLGHDMESLARAEAQGHDKSAIKLALRAFGAGITVRHPEWRVADELMADVHSRRAA